MRERPADSAAELIALQHVALQGEEVARVQFVVAQEFEQHAVKVVAAGLGGPIHHAAGIPKLGAVFALLDLKFLQRVDGCLNQRAALMMIGGIDAIEIEGRLGAANAADRSARFVVGADAEQIPGARQQRGAGRQSRKFVETASVQGKIDDLLIGDFLAERAGLCIQHRGRRE